MQIKALTAVSCRVPLDQWCFKALCKFGLQLLNQEAMWHGGTAGDTGDRKGFSLVPVGARVQVDLE